MSAISIRTLVKSSLPLGYRTNYETIAQNLSQYQYQVNQTNSIVTSIVYTVDSSNTITKTFNYDGTGKLISITITGTALGGTYTKTLTYSGTAITGALYSSTV